MSEVPLATTLLQELDARQDEVLAKLNELNGAVETLLKQYLDSQRASRLENEAVGGVEGSGESDAGSVLAVEMA